MGAWGYGLYQNDDAEDIKEIFKEEYEKNQEVKKIEEKMKNKFASMLKDEEDAPVFWCILADLEWRYGVLTENTKKVVLEFIENGGDIEFWRENESDEEAKKREKVLKKLAEKLKTPQPPKRKITKKRPYICKWNIGDIFAYKLTQEGSEGTEYHNKYVIFQVVDKYENIDNHIMPHVHMYKKVFERVPQMEDLDNLPCIIFKRGYYERKSLCTYELGFYSLERSRSFKKEDLQYIGNKEINKEIYKDYKILKDKYFWYHDEEIFWNFFDSHIITYIRVSNVYEAQELVDKMEIFQYPLYREEVSENIRFEYKKLYAKGINVKEIEKKLYEKYTKKLNDDEEFNQIITDNKWRSGERNINNTEYEQKYIYENNVKIYDKEDNSNNILKEAEEGDVFAYKITSNDKKYDGKYIIIQKISNYLNPLNETKAHIRIYEKIFEEIPKIEELYNFADITKNSHFFKTQIDIKSDNIIYPLPIFCNKNEIIYGVYINIDKEKTEEKLFKIGNVERKPTFDERHMYKENRIFLPESINWKNLDKYIENLFEYNEIIKERMKRENIDIKRKFFVIL